MIEYWIFGGMVVAMIVIPIGLHLWLDSYQAYRRKRNKERKKLKKNMLDLEKEFKKEIELRCKKEKKHCE